MQSNSTTARDRSLYLLLFVEIFFLYAFIVGLGQFIYPVIIACIVLYISLPAIDLLERYTKLARYIAVSIIFIIQLYIIVKIITQGLPYILAETQKLLLALPNLIKNIVNYTNNTLATYNIDFQMESKILEDKSTVFFKDLAALNYVTLENTLSLATDTASHIIGHLMWIVDLVLIPLMYLFLGINYKSIIHGIQNNTPVFLKEEMHLLLLKSNDIFAAYIRGQIILVCTLAAGYSTGFMLIGLPYGFTLGIITGLLSFVPYLGTIIGFVTSSLILFTLDSNILAYLSLYSVFIVVHGLEYSVLIPSLVGQHVGLSFFTSFIALLIGASNFGVIGAVFAMPLTAIGKHIFERLKIYCHQQGTL